MEDDARMFVTLVANLRGFCNDRELLRAETRSGCIQVSETIETLQKGRKRSKFEVHRNGNFLPL